MKFAFNKYFSAALLILIALSGIFCKRFDSEELAKKTSDTLSVINEEFGISFALYEGDNYYIPGFNHSEILDVEFLSIEKSWWYKYGNYSVIIKFFPDAKDQIDITSGYDISNDALLNSEAIIMQELSNENPAHREIVRQFIQYSCPQLKEIISFNNDTNINNLKALKIIYSYVDENIDDAVCIEYRSYNNPWLLVVKFTSEEQLFSSLKDRFEIIWQSMKVAE